MKKFGLIGVAGYIAPRHLKAIKDTGNELLCALDPSDCVGIMDSYFPQCDFFTEFERFDRHIDKLRRKGMGLDFISVCSPNYLHDAHIRFGLRNGANVICEKPLVLNPWNIDGLEILEKENGKKVYNILQLRLHESIISLKDRVEADLKKNPNKKYEVELTYITSRGKWYFVSWKGNETKSGGVATNIGVHFFDMLGWIFGELKNLRVDLLSQNSAAGILEFANANVKWFLSVDDRTLPIAATSTGKRTYREININGEILEFSEGFTELHTQSYKDILSGGGFGLETARKCIEIVHKIRNEKVVGICEDSHKLYKELDFLK